MKARIYANHPECLFDWLLSLEKVSSNNWVEVDVEPARLARWKHAISEFEDAQADMQTVLSAMDVDPRDINLGPCAHMTATIRQEDTP